MEHFEPQDGDSEKVARARKAAKNAIKVLQSKLTTAQKKLTKATDADRDELEQAVAVAQQAVDEDIEKRIAKIQTVEGGDYDAAGGLSLQLLVPNQHTKAPLIPPSRGDHPHCHAARHTFWFNYCASADAGNNAQVATKTATETLINWMNQRFCFITRGPRVLMLEASNLDGAPVHVDQPLKAFSESMSVLGLPTFAWVPPKQHEKAINALKKSSIVKLWTEGPRREATGRYFAPPLYRNDDSSGLPHGYINTWAGYAISEEKARLSGGSSTGPGAMAFVKHIRENVAGGDPAQTKYMLNWLAHMIQSPGQKAKTAVVMRGEEGTGKGILHAVCAEILGRSYVRHPSGRSQFVGRFVTIIEDCVLLFADEVHWSGNAEEGEVLKKIITEDCLTVEHKGVDAADVRNTCHVMMASNQDWVVPAGPNARRYAVFDVKPTEDRKPRDLRHLMTPAALNDIAVLLHTFDVEGELELPESAGLTDQKIQSLKGINAWLAGLVTQGDRRFFGREVSKAEVFEAYKQHLGRSSFPPDASNFWKSLRKTLPTLKDHRKGAGGVNGWVVCLGEFEAAAETIAKSLGVTVAALTGEEIPNVVPAAQAHVQQVLPLTPAQSQRVSPVEQLAVVPALSEEVADMLLDYFIVDAAAVGPKVAVPEVQQAPQQIADVRPVSWQVTEEDACQDFEAAFGVSFE